MKTAFQIFSVLILLALQLTGSVSAAYDWEEEEGGQVEREIQLTRNRAYPGGADEQDLKVQKSLAQASRSPEAAPELVKRDDAAPDEE